jgi:hypothetical protein
MRDTTKEQGEQAVVGLWCFPRNNRVQALGTYYHEPTYPGMAALICRVEIKVKDYSSKFRRTREETLRPAPKFPIFRSG